jgi:hypothetical protein
MKKGNQGATKVVAPWQTGLTSYHISLLSYIIISIFLLPDSSIPINTTEIIIGNQTSFRTLI